MRIPQLRELMEKKEISSLELTDCFLDRIKRENDRIGAYITVCEEEARRQAIKADSEIAHGKNTAITGIPLSVKDNICTAGVSTTCGSKMLSEFIPSYNATAKERLDACGAVMLGKVNMDEFAIGATGEMSALLSTMNPINSEYVPGGSSSGSAAAVAAGLCTASIGSDTGGSVRVPASCCGLVGFKPSYGAISRYGLVAHASSLDQIGVIARSVEDVATVAFSMYGQDERDVSSKNVPSVQKTLNSLSGVRFAFSDEFLKTADTEVADIVSEAVELMEKNGACRENVYLSKYFGMTDIYRVIASAELSSNLARFDGIKYGSLQCDSAGSIECYRSSMLGREVKKRILLGNYVLSAENFSETYEKACNAREEVRCELESVFERADVLLAPVSDSVVSKRGEAIRDDYESYRADIHTVAANLAGLPAVSIPVKRDKNGMPVSVQLMSAHMKDSELIAVAKAFEKALYGGNAYVL